MRTIWIIDGAYMLKGSPKRFDILKLQNELSVSNGNSIVNSYYFNSTKEFENDEQRKFYSWLKVALPNGPQMEVILSQVKRLRCECPACHHRFAREIQKGVDVAIATQLIKLAVRNKYDRVILLAGDGDFESAVEYVKNDLKKEIWIVGFRGSISLNLQAYADRVIWVNSLWKIIGK